MIRTVRAIVVSTILVTAATPVFAAGVSATDLKTKMQQVMQQNPELMHALMGNPNHRLAMAYRHNLMNFAVALKKLAQSSETIPGDVARTAVGEMKRSADLLEKQHDAVLRTLSAEKKGQLQDLPKLMQQHLADIRTRLDHLDQLAKKEQVPSAEVLKDLAFLTEQCRMGGMHGGMMRRGPGNGMHMMMQEEREGDAELQDLVKRMNDAPEAQKVGIMAEIVNRLVEQKTEMNDSDGMFPHGSHPMMQHPQMDHQDGPSDGADYDSDMDMDMEEME
jgi:hypothetical protein